MNNLVILQHARYDDDWAESEHFLDFAPVTLLSRLLI